MKTKRRMVAVLALCLFINVYGAAQKRGTRRAGSRPAPVAKNGTLSLQAGIVYKAGGPQPVARVEFHLLDDDLENILRNAGLTGTMFHQDYGLTFKYAMARRSPEGLLMADNEPKDNGQFLQAAQTALLPHIKRTVTTDFSGNAQFEPVPAGTYYVLGVTETRSGVAIWNLKVEIKPGQNQVILDQNNASSIT